MSKVKLILIMMWGLLVVIVGCGGGGGDNGGGNTLPIVGKTFGGSGDDFGWSVQQTSDGGYVIGGFTNSKGAGGYDAYIIKTDANGNKTNEVTFGGAGDDFCFSVQQTRDGGYIATGTYNVATGSSPAAAGFPKDMSGDLFIRKMDSNLNLTWQKIITGKDTGTGFPYDMGYAIQQTADDGYIVVGATGTGSGGECPY